MWPLGGFPVSAIRYVANAGLNTPEPNSSTTITSTRPLSPAGVAASRHNHRARPTPGGQQDAALAVSAHQRSEGKRAEHAADAERPGHPDARLHREFDRTDEQTERGRKQQDHRHKAAGHGDKPDAGQPQDAGPPTVQRRPVHLSIFTWQKCLMLHN